MRDENLDQFCTYCGIAANTEDHTVPRWLLRRAGELGLDLSRMFRLQNWVVPSCHECNSFLGARLFPTLRERRRAAHAGISRKYAHYLRIPHWDEHDLAELGPMMRVEVLRGVEMREWVRGRLVWAGATRMESVEAAFALAHDVARLDGEKEAVA